MEGWLLQIIALAVLTDQRIAVFCKRMGCCQHRHDLQSRPQSFSGSRIVPLAIALPIWLHHQVEIIFRQSRSINTNNMAAVFLRLLQFLYCFAYQLLPGKQVKMHLPHLLPTAAVGNKGKTVTVCRILRCQIRNCFPKLFPIHRMFLLRQFRQIGNGLSGRDDHMVRVGRTRVFHGKDPV